MNKNILKVIITLIIVIFATAGCFFQNQNESGDKIFVFDGTAGATGGKITSRKDVVKKNKVDPSGDLEVYFLDVGQADCIFVQNCGKTMLIDAGNNPDGKYISKYLRKELGIKRIDYLIGTHPHEDHIGGLDIIIEDFEIGNLYMPSRKVDNKTYDDVIKTANNAGISIISPNNGNIFNVGTATCEIMTKNDDAEDVNNTSIVVEMSFGSKKFLFTGDILSSIEESRSWNDIDVLKVSHHGSVYSSTESFLNQVKPEIAVIMCGKNNDYHYPHEGVLDRLKEVGCQNVYITSKDGTILLKCDGKDIVAECLPQLDFDGNK